jgi:hypothetical protein
MCLSQLFSISDNRYFTIIAIYVSNHPDYHFDHAYCDYCNFISLANLHGELMLMIHEKKLSISTICIKRGTISHACWLFFSGVFFGGVIDVKTSILLPCCPKQ